MKTSGRVAVYVCALWLFLASGRLGFASTAITCSSPAPTAADAQFEYFVSVGEHDRHLLRIAVRYHSSESMRFEMPVWNALYQVRDFSQYVTETKARNSNGTELAITTVDKTAWRVEAADGCAVLEYTAYANTAGPFSSQANGEHVFLNWAQVLVYPSNYRSAAITLSVADVPPAWSLRDLGRFDETVREGTYHLAKAISYDQLVDSPVEIGPTKTSIFEEDGARYRLVIDADAKDYDLPLLQDAIKKVVHAEVDWMQDRPFDQYTFLYHFPRGSAGGGMEHSYGTAITTPAPRVRENPLAPIDTTAHEFFHLWNVKRIRPQQMEPVDYEHEQPTRALWFCEGVTSTASELMLVRAGLVNERGYLAHVSEEIGELESRPARRFQSPEASSVDAWMEGRAYYRRPERSVSYYTSGEVLGVLLDLRIRALTGGRRSLRDLFQRMNANYAKRGRFYDDVRGVQEEAEKLTGSSFEEFFSRYVRGTESIPYDDFFRPVGLKLEPFTILGTDAGFDAGINFSGLPEVVSITPGSAVEAAGVHVGDTLAAINDAEYVGDLSSYLVGHKPGETIAFRFLSRGRPVNVKVALKPSNQPGYALVDLREVTAEQRTQRQAWITGEDVAGDAR
jgi:predicted metalloprotease with PDZ domain